jgi:2-dehydro-3-deoxygluconokinase
VFSAVEVAGAAGIPVSFDPNYRAALWSPDAASAVCQDLAAKADVIFATEEEAAMLVGPGSPEQLSAALAARGPGQVLIKLGAAGAVARVDGRPRRVDPVTVPVVDTVGAGDGFAAGYLWGLITGREVDERLRVAALTGAFAVTVAGDWEGLPSLPELDLLAHPSGTVTR